jgi:hypothetical protein
MTTNCVCACACVCVYVCVCVYIYIIQNHTLHAPLYLLSNLIRRASGVSLETFKQSNSPDIRGHWPHKYVYIFF